MQTLVDKSRSGLRPDARILTLFHDVEDGRIITARASLYVRRRPTYRARKRERVVCGS